MTPAEAQRLQDEAQARGRWLMWFVAVSAGKARAWALMADPQGGRRVPGEMVADTLDELRAMLPLGLKRDKPTELMPPEVVEVWD